MKFRERYANQTASIRRPGVAAATLSRSANLLGADSKEAKAARNLQVQRKHDVHERERERARERERERERESSRRVKREEEERRDPLKIEMRMKERNGDGRI